MKIIYLHQYFNTPEMSGGTRSYEMAKRLVRKGHEVHLITSWREVGEKQNWFRTKTDGIHIHWLPVPYSNNMSYSKRIISFFSFALNAGKKAQEVGGDIVFASSTPLTISIPGITTAKKLRIPMIFEVRDLWPELPIVMGALKNPILKFLARKLEIYSYKNARHIIALSPGMAEGVIKTGYPKDQVSIIPNSADLDLFQPNQEKAEQFRLKYSELGDGPIVLYAGTLGIINGVCYLVELAAQVEKINPKIRFVVFGRGAEWIKVQNKASELGVLDKNFFIYPSIPKNELVSAFCAAKISTSLFVDVEAMQANSANKFFDTLASETPVAINYGGWQASLIKEYNTGIHLSRNINDAAISIADLLEQPEKLKNMGINARNLAKNKFSRDLLADELEKVLVDALIKDSD